MPIQFNEDLIKVSCDSGRSGSKYAFVTRTGEIQADVITTVVTDANGDEAGFTGDTDVVSIEGIPGIEGKWFVGGIEGDLTFNHDESKLNSTHEIAIYTTIARTLIVHLGLDLTKVHNVELSVNIPLEDFKVADIKSQYIEMYSQKDEFGQPKVVKVTLNDKTVAFKIVAVKPYFEGQGAIIRNMNLVNKESVINYVFCSDLGSRNDTHILFNGLKPTPKNHMSGNGSNRALRQLAAKIYNITKDSYTVTQVEEILLGKLTINTLKKEEIQELFEPIGMELANAIKSQIDMHSIQRSSTPVLFTGGTSIILRPYLKKVMSNDENPNLAYTIYFSDDARFDNAKGALIKALS